jgi:hypothetical protein
MMQSAIQDVSCEAVSWIRCSERPARACMLSPRVEGDYLEVRHWLVETTDARSRAAEQ